MAINPLSLCEVSPPCSLSVKSGPARFKAMAFHDDHKITKRHRKKIKGARSPYLLAGDRVSYLERVTEKRIVHKQADGFLTSFPLAANVYKANSAELKPPKQKSNKKVKKSVLTLPNEQSLMPQTCTVSDLNAAEYARETKHKVPTLKRAPLKKKRLPAKGFEYYDREARLSSQMNLECSSSDILKHFGGDGKRNKRKGPEEKEVWKPHDVWTVLRDINRFQFNPSPPMSIDSASSPRKTVVTRKRNSRKGNRRLIETCRTEEISYVANFEFETTQHRSRSTSCDRITVIDMNVDNQNGRAKQIRNTFEKCIQEKCAKNQIATNDMIAPRTGKKDNKLAMTDIRTRQTKVNKHVVESNLKEVCTTETSIDSSNYYANMHMADGDKPITKRRDRLVRDEHKSNDPMIQFRSSSPDKGINIPSLAHFRDNRPSRPHPEAPSPLRKLAKIFLGKQDNEKASKEDIAICHAQKRRPRLATTMSSATAIPKCTVADVKRKLAELRFPIVVLGKDQIRSSFEMPDYDPPQFNGLDEHIWPFMTEWKKKGKNKSRGAQHNDNKHAIANNARPTKDIKKNANEIAISKHSKDMKGNENAVKKRAENKNMDDLQFVITDDVTVPHLNQVTNAKIPKQNNTRHFRDTKIKLLYKKTSDLAVQDSDRYPTDPKLNAKVQSEITVQKVDIATEPIVFHSPVEESWIPTRPDRIVTSITRNKRSNPPMALWTPADGTMVPMTTPEAIWPHVRKQPWSKGKLTNDFIDNIIRKVKSGVYYNNEPRPKKVEFVDLIALCNNRSTEDEGSDRNVVSMQTPRSFRSNESDIEDFSTELTSCIDVALPDNYDDPLKKIPGFDDALSELEIKSLDMYQIAVKQCTTNILVHFDVKILDKSDATMQDVATDCRCIPLNITESHTRVFKYNATILNAVLPAQLCTLLPRLIRNPMALGEYKQYPMFPIEATSSYLSMISEGSRSEIPLTLIQLPSLIIGNMSLAKKEFLRGTFAGKLWRFQQVIEIISTVVDYRSKFNTPMPVVIPQKVIIIVVDVFYPLALNPGESQEDSDDRSEMVSACTALPQYNSSKSLVPGVGDLSYMRMMKFNLPTFISPIKLSCYYDKITVNMIVDSQGIEKAMSVTISNVKLQSLFNGFAKNNSFITMSNKAKDVPLKCIEHICAYPTGKSVKRDVLPCVKPRKRPYVRLYKKCKSSSNIEKSGWSLSTINTLEEFFECIGPAKSLVNVFDGAAEKRILSAITIMKNWITEITPRQALLVLLLVNKKDTPNLKRFQELLLEGIAMNRITRSSELDMEIAVIENENIQLEPSDEVPNTGASVRNDSLLEELLWIAKTTASDHKRPFDESSEILLKSLLEKRKKLNPSYLRVMARYIGLGLVKSPSKHQN